MALSRQTITDEFGGGPLVCVVGVGKTNVDPTIQRIITLMGKLTNSSESERPGFTKIKPYLYRLFMKRAR